MKYVHTNIIAKDWKLLSDFYIKVFNCKPVPPEKNLKGDWLEKGTGVKDASLQGINLLLPGFDKDGPTLEIFQYQENENKPNPAANREGFGHIAFSVDDVNTVLDKMIHSGGRKIGEVIRKDFGKGTLIFTYAADPEGNIIELQKWEPKDL
ncbi:VOC family protein [candidate division KSB1 bacterium]